MVNRIMLVLMSGLVISSLSGEMAAASRTLWDTYVDAGERAVAEGRLAAAERLFAAAYSEARMLGQPDHPTLKTVEHLVGVYEAQGKRTEAIRLLESVLSHDAETAVKSVATKANLQVRLATFYVSSGEYDRARRFLEEALSGFRRAKGDPLAEASALHNLGSIAYLEGRYSDAGALLKQALALRRHSLGDEHPATAATLNNLGAVAFAQGKLPEATSLLSEALQTRRAVLGATHPDLAKTLANLGSAHYELGRLEQARQLLEEALAIHESGEPRREMETARVLQNLGVVNDALGNGEHAESYFIRALGLRSRVFGPRHPETALTLSCLAMVYGNQGRGATARALIQQALSIQQEKLPADHPATAETLRRYVTLVDSSSPSDPTRDIMP